MKKSRIKMYNPEIYPRKVWICTIDDFDIVKDMFTFYYPSDTEKVNYNPKLDEDAYAAVYPVSRKSDDLLGILVVINDMDEISVAQIAHESVHVADYIYEQLGIYTQDFSCSNEHYTYLVGWVAGKISEYLISIK